MGITHAFTSTKDQGGDSELVSKNEWNADHVGDLVVPRAGDGIIVVPGLAGSPNRLPSYPNEWDDEFTSLTGWTTLGSFTTSNVTDFPSHWHAYRSGSGTEVDGIYKAAPPMPFTVTAHISDLLTGVNFWWVGLLLTESAPGKLFTWGPDWNNGLSLEMSRWTNRTTRASNTNYGTGYVLYQYIRMVVTSSTIVDLQASVDGHIWRSFGTVTTSMTVANVGLHINLWSGYSTIMDATFDWIRFTRPTFTVDAVIGS